MRLTRCLCPGAALLAALLCVLLATAAWAREIVDMAGRTVTLPERLERVYAMSPPAFWHVYVLAPEVLVGLNQPMTKPTLELLDPRMATLPVAGGSFGNSTGPDREALLALHPDCAIFWGARGSGLDMQLVAELERLGIPSVFVDLDTVQGYAAGLRFLGKLLGRGQRAEELARYGEAALARVADMTASLGPDGRVPVYYAEGPDGLATDGSGSWHSELIELAGGRNVHAGPQKSRVGQEKLSMETVMAYNPAVILSADKAFLKALPGDTRWAAMEAVRKGRVYAIPTEPLNWFDRPPSAMRYLGVQWLAATLHPDRFPLDIRAETKRFYALFLGKTLDDATVTRILREQP